MEAADNTQTNLAKERLKDLDLRLDGILSSYGVLSDATPNADEFGRLLTLSHIELAKLTPEQCSEGAYILRQGAFTLQKEYNRERAREVWANAQIDKTVAEEMGQFDKYMRYEQKRALAIKQNSFAFKLNEIQVYAQSRAIRLESLSDKASDMARALNELSMSRRKVY